MTPTKEDNIRLVKYAIDALNTGETSRVSEFISPIYFNHESQMDPVRSKMRGPQEFIDTVVNLRKAISDIHYELLESVASNEKVVSIVSVRGKHTGSFFGFIPPSGNKISYQAVHIFTIGDDGKITEHKAIRDDLALMYQLGVVKGTSLEYENFLKEWKRVEW
ncbi:MAG TPA: ester cyclase [Nitrososphaeraceae archaeon]|jgi:predicted ester cyclase|nr:ester cyclase [Nitrososphaeraceae archaeon]